jgi:hypothetical protein
VSHQAPLLVTFFYFNECGVSVVKSPRGTWVGCRAAGVFGLLGGCVASELASGRTYWCHPTLRMFAREGATARVPLRVLTETANLLPRSPLSPGCRPLRSWKENAEPLQPAAALALLCGLMSLCPCRTSWGHRRALRGTINQPPHTPAVSPACLSHHPPMLQVPLEHRKHSEATRGSSGCINVPCTLGGSRSGLAASPPSFLWPFAFLFLYRFLLKMARGAWTPQ